MTVVCLTSVKSAPGVTTTACLVGAAWPPARRVFVAECDPAGGDLAARFALSTSSGWSTYGPAVRRAGAPVAITPHLRQLSGGLDILIGTRRSTNGESDRLMPGLLASILSLPEPIDVLVDLGRLSTGPIVADGWSDRSDAVLVILRSDPASIMQVADRASELLHRWGERVGLVMIGDGRHNVAEIERFTGISVVAALPFEPGAAAVAAGERAGRLRLERSPLAPAAGRLADYLCCPLVSPTVDHAVPVKPAVAKGRLSNRRWLAWRRPRRSVSPAPKSASGKVAGVRRERVLR